MALEQDVQKAVDALVVRLRDSLGSDVRGLVHELVTRSDAERQTLIDEARRTADAERTVAVTAARAETQEKADADAEAKMTAAVNAMKEQAKAAVAKIQQSLIAEKVAAVTRARQEVAAEQAKAIEAEVAKVRADAEQVLATSLADAQAADRDQIAADVRERVEQEMAGELAKARGASHKGEQAAVARLLDSVRRLDAQPTLTAILDTLTELIASEAGRVAVFVQTDGEMRGWRFAGFGPDLGDARSRVLDGADAGFLSQAIGQRRTRTLSANGDRAGSDRPPGFAALPADRSALAVPVLVGGEVMVVVYADDVSDERPSVLLQWSDAVEFLARHAGRRLEALTADRAAALARGVMPSGLDGPVERAPDAPGALSEDEEAARRYARLLVSEIKLYNENTVNDGRAKRDLGFRLKNEIARARSLYEERISESVRSRSPFFKQELVRTLAGGDPSLIGN